MRFLTIKNTYQKIKRIIPAGSLRKPVYQILTGFFLLRGKNEGRNKIIF